MIHVVIVSYSRWEKIEDLCSEVLLSNDSLKDQDLWLHVVDNYGDTAIHSGLKLYSNTTYLHVGNLGYGQAFNYALSKIQMTQSDLFIVANDDIKLSNGSLENLIQSYAELKKQNSKLGVLSPSYESSDGVTDSGRYFKLLNSQTANYSEMSFGPAACWLMDFNFIKHVGGFIPSFFMYGEDLELLNRAAHYGFKNYLIHDVTVVHDFQYPVADKKLRVIKEENIMAALFLNPKGSLFNACSFATKGLIVSLISGSFTRGKYILQGFYQFLKSLNFLSKVKASHENTVELRYVKPFLSGDIEFAKAVVK